jgi:hypothetical protein
MLTLQLLSVAVALFTFTAPSLCDTLEVLNPPHARIGIPSIDFHDGLAQHISSDFAASMQNLPLNHGLKPTRAMKRGPKILEYKLVKPKGRGNAKRADGDNSPALFSFPNCLVCTGKRKDDERLTVRDNFQADQMVGMMLPGGMTGECLFCRLPRPETLMRILTASIRCPATARSDILAKGHVVVKTNYRILMSIRREVSDDLGKSLKPVRKPSLTRVM